MVCAPVRSIIPSLKLGDYLSVQAHSPCSISHVTTALPTYYITLNIRGVKFSRFIENDILAHFNFGVHCGDILWFMIVKKI